MNTVGLSTVKEALIGCIEFSQLGPHFLIFKLLKLYPLTRDGFLLLALRTEQLQLFLELPTPCLTLVQLLAQYFDTLFSLLQLAKVLSFELGLALLLS
jgi:hypothetical protein